MNIRLFRFTKRSNSTARPSTDGWPVDVLLKDETSILRPSFLLKHDPNEPAEVYDYNYVFCQEFERYYHITNIEAVRNDLWRIDCDVDVLASWKTQIQAANAFVAYSTTLGNAQLIDRRLSVTTPKLLASNYAAFPTFGYCTNGTKAVILTVTGKARIGHYCVNTGVAQNILNSISNWMDGIDVLPFTPGQGLSAVIDGLRYIGDCLTRFARQLVATGNAAENITNAITVPIPWGTPVGTNAEIVLGQFETGMYGNFISETDRTLNDFCTIPIPWQTADFRRQSPYTQIIVYCPFIGYVNISPAQVMGDAAIQISVDLDIFTGDAIFTLRGVTADATPVYHVIGQYAINVAGAFPIGRSMQTPLSIGTAVIQEGTGLIQTVTGNVAMGVSNTIQGIVGAMQEQPTTIVSGGGSAFMSMPDRRLCYLYLIYHDTNVNPASVNQVIGRPTMEVSAMNVFSGYVETRGFSVSGPMTEHERMEINSSMDGGVYIE